MARTAIVTRTSMVAALGIVCGALIVLALPGPVSGVAAAPTLTTSAAPTASATQPDDSRFGGSDPAPARGKPGWVWWVATAFLVILGATGYRLWRSAAGSDRALGSDSVRE